MNRPFRCLTCNTRHVQSARPDAKPATVAPRCAICGGAGRWDDDGQVALPLMEPDTCQICAAFDLASVAVDADAFWTMPPRFEPLPVMPHRCILVPIVDDE